MATASLSIILILQRTAEHLAKADDYQWGHMGSCNCGFLAREVTRVNKKEIHRYALQQCGDWSEQLREYCPTSGLPMDGLIGALLEVGFDTNDLTQLERLSDSRILSVRASKPRTLQFNIKSDVVEYLRLWAEMLEGRLMDGIQLPDLQALARGPENEYNL